MSNETGLNDQERRILASLAEKATADDPSLAAALRGGVRRRRPPTLPPLLGHWAAGVVLAVVGLALTLLSLSTVLVLGFAGLLLTVAGTTVVVTDRARIRAARLTTATERISERPEV